ncbi:MAG: hypothetical protein HOC60_08240 [Rhodospirillaceae bacterium]|nr:hypothetical protein [Rhodospirillaceae bacterium]
MEQAAFRQSFEGPQGNEQSSVLVLQAVDGAALVVPGDAWLLKADFSPQGPDLLLTGADGTQILIRDFYTLENPPDLMTDQGAVISAELAQKLAGPIAPGVVAQNMGGPVQIAQTETGNEPIGKVEATDGLVEAIHTDGTRVTLSKGDSIFEGDTIETGKGAAIGITFVDETTFSLGEDGRMVIDEMVYDPGTQEGAFNANLVQGVFSFVSGQIAKTGPDSMTVTTPVATIGIRGTKVAGRAAQEGAENTISLLPEIDAFGNSFVGQLAVTNQGGTVTLSQVGATVQMTSSLQAPPPPVVFNEQQIQENFGATLTTLSTAASSRATEKAAEDAEKADEAEAEAEAATAEAEAAEAEAAAAAAEAEAAAAAAEAAAAAAEAEGTPEAIAAAEEAAAAAEAAAAEAEAAAVEAQAQAAEAEAAQAVAETAQAEAQAAQQQAQAAANDLAAQTQAFGSFGGPDGGPAPGEGEQGGPPDGGPDGGPDAGPDGSPDGGPDDGGGLFGVGEDGNTFFGSDGDGDDGLFGGPGDDLFGGPDDGGFNDPETEGNPYDFSTDPNKRSDPKDDDDDEPPPTPPKTEPPETGVNSIIGTSADDVLVSTSDNDIIDGGAGTDTVVFAGNLAGYSLALDPVVGGATVIDTAPATSGDDGVDTLVNVEKLEFDDTTLTLSRGDGEFLVNTVTNGEQEFPQALSLADGGFLITYRGVDADSSGILGKLYDSAGNPLGLEFQINSETTGIQSNTYYNSDNTIALADGGFAVGWHSYQQDVSDGGWAAMTRFFDANGTAVTDEIVLNTYTASEQAHVTIIQLTSGDLVYAWQSLGQDAAATYGIYGQRMNVAGEKIGSEFHISTTTASTQYQPTLVALDNGGFASFWTSDGQTGGNGTAEIIGQIYNSTASKIGGEFQVNTYVTSSQHFPNVIQLSNDNIVVAWQSVSQDGNQGGVYGQIMTEAGAFVGVEFQLSTATYGEQGAPRMAALENGGFIATWHDGVNGNDFDNTAQIFDSTGGKVGTEFRINSYLANDQTWPDVTVTEDGGFITTWQSDLQDGNLSGVYAQRFDADGNATGTTTLTGTVANEDVTLSDKATSTHVDLGGGTDSLTLADATNFIAVSNTETITGGTGNDTVTTTTALSGDSVDLGDGTDTLKLTDGPNSVTVSNTETITGGADSDSITINGTTSATITGGTSGDNFYLAGTSAGQTLRYATKFDGATVTDSLTGRDMIYGYTEGQDSIGIAGSLAAIIDDSGGAADGTITGAATNGIADFTNDTHEALFITDGVSNFAGLMAQSGVPTIIANFINGIGISTDAESDGLIAYSTTNAGSGYGGGVFLFEENGTTLNNVSANELTYIATIDSTVVTSNITSDIDIVS